MSGIGSRDGQIFIATLGNREQTIYSKVNVFIVKQKTTKHQQKGNTANMKIYSK